MISQICPEKGLKTLAEWQCSGLRTIGEYLQLGDYVDQTLIEYFRNSASPILDRQYILQAGTPANHVKKLMPDGTTAISPTFLTFLRRGPEWKFFGACLQGDTVDLTGVYQVRLRADGSYAEILRRDGK